MKLKLSVKIMFQRIYLLFNENEQNFDEYKISIKYFIFPMN